MKKILLLTTCLLSTLVAADQSAPDNDQTGNRSTEGTVNYRETADGLEISTHAATAYLSYGSMDAHNCSMTNPLKRKREEVEAEEEPTVSSPKKPKNDVVDRLVEGDDMLLEFNLSVPLEGGSRELGESDYDSYLDLNKPGLFCSGLMLPKDILLHALDYLVDTEDLLAFYRVNKASKFFLMQQEKLWQSTVFKSPIVPSPLVRFVKILNMCGGFVDRCGLLQNFPNLTTLTLNDGRLDVRGKIRQISDISMLAQCRNLERLFLGEEDIEYEELSNYEDDIVDLSPLKGLPKLKNLGLNYRFFSNFSDLPNSIEILSLEGVYNVPNLYHLSSLSEVSLSLCSHFHDVDLASLNGIDYLDLSNSDIEDVSDLGSVYRLDLYGCTEITDVSALGNVHTLDLTGCTGITNVKALGNVHKLNLTDCTGIPEEQITELRKTVKHLILPDGTEHRI